MTDTRHTSRNERTFPICKDHTDSDWNQPALDDDGCVLCRLFYLEAQESLLEEWQQRAKKAEDAIKEMERPLDAQMARLNATVERLNGENELLRSVPSEIGRNMHLRVGAFGRIEIHCTQCIAQTALPEGPREWREIQEAVAGFKCKIEGGRCDG